MTSSSAVIPFAFEEHLIRVIMRGVAPWFVVADVCRAIGITWASTAVEKLDEDEKGMDSIHTPGGDQEVLIVCEGGLYTLILRSRAATTPGSPAHRFRRWLTHEVLPALRERGIYRMPGAVEPEASPQGELPLALRLSMVREARLLFGHARARLMWGRLRLPEPPLAPPEPLDEAFACLRHLLDQEQPIVFYPDSPPFTVREMIQRALDDDEDARSWLGWRSIRATPDDQSGFVVANGGESLDKLFARTPYSDGRWVTYLRRLPGAARSGPHKFDDVARRGTFIPARYLDPAASEPVTH